jgi:hypothetical protein
MLTRNWSGASSCLPESTALSGVTSEIYTEAYRTAFRQKAMSAAIDILRDAGLKTLRDGDNLMIFVEPTTRIFRAKDFDNTAHAGRGGTRRYRIALGGTAEVAVELPPEINVKFLSTTRLDGPPA